jgi:hypothetical protein
MGTKHKYYSDFLFSTPNFLTGAGSVINLAGNYYKFNASKTGCEADNMAIENDFNMIGQDINDALKAIH